MSADMSEVRKHYTKCFEQHGATPQGVAWGANEERVADRYNTLVSKIPFGKEPLTLLDVGSGYGELIKYIPAAEFKYTGIDITESAVLHGRKLYPQHHFIHEDFLAYNFTESFDVVVCSGALSLKMDISNKDMLLFVHRAILKMYEICNKMVVFNIMSTNVNFFSKGMFYKSPVEMLSWCFDNVCNRVDVDHSSVEFEYTVTLKK